MENLKTIKTLLIEEAVEKSLQEYPEDFYMDPDTREIEDFNRDKRIAYVKGFTNGVEEAFSALWKPTKAQVEALKELCDNLYKLL